MVCPHFIYHAHEYKVKTFPTPSCQWYVIILCCYKVFLEKFGDSKYCYYLCIRKVFSRFNTFGLKVFFVKNTFVGKVFSRKNT